jgi:pantoate--beta-alanine ligase
VKIVHEASELTAVVRSFRTEGLTVAVVPTMGALHAGHEALIRRAKKECERVVVTIFVNRLQFNDQSDFDRYPVTLDADLDMCSRNGVEAVYAPRHTTMYPDGFATVVSVDGLGDRLEGASRPGHFDGVTTVVTKLLVAAEADVAVFGQKDFQQVSIVRRLVRDLDVPTRIVVEPTVRDHDGLALSSRNVRLDPEARRAAVAVPRSLDIARRLVGDGASDRDLIEAAVREHLLQSGLEVDYATIVDRDTLEKVSFVRESSVLLVAVTVGGVRLIDNTEL